MYAVTPATPEPTGCLDGRLLTEEMVRGWVAWLVRRVGSRKPKKIAKHLGALFSRATDGNRGWDGILIRLPESGRWGIAVNSLLSPIRAEYAAAHEVTHLIIERTTINPPQPGDTHLEQLADAGAHELLFGWD